MSLLVFSHCWFVVITYLLTSRRYKIVELLSLMIDDDSMSYALLSASSLNLQKFKYRFSLLIYLLTNMSVERIQWSICIHT